MIKKLEIYHSDDSMVNVSMSSQKYLKKAYGRYFEEEIINIASNRNLNGTDLRVLLCIIGNLKYENVLSISQREIGEILKIKKQEISKSIGKLIKEEYLQIIDKIGRQNIYKFNPKIAFKSRAKNHKELCNEWQEDINWEEQKTKKEKNENENLQIKFDKKINQISEKFQIEKEKAKDILLLIINQGLNNEEKNKINLPY